MQRRNLWALIIVLIMLMVLINYTGEGRERLTILEDAAYYVFVPVQEIFASAGKNVQSFFEAFIHQQEIKAENERLREKIAQYREKSSLKTEIEQENERLREMLDFQERTEKELLPAEVISRDPNKWFTTITLNRGKRDGVEKEMPVVVPQGLTGMVSSVSWSTCQVILLTDPRLSVSAMVQRSRDPGTMGVIEGYLEETSRLEFINIPPDADIQEGDLIITSGLGGVFPQNISIGIVEEIKLDETGLVQNALVKPEVNFHRLEEVFIVVSG